MRKFYSTILFISIHFLSFTNFGQNKMPSTSLSKPFLWTYQLPDEDVIGPMDVLVSGSYHLVREIVGEKIHANCVYKIDKMVFTPKFGDLRFKYKGRIYKANEVAGTDGQNAMIGWGDVKITGINISIKAVNVKNATNFNINPNFASAYDIGEIGREQDLNNISLELVGSFATSIYFSNHIGLLTRLDKLEKLMKDREDYKRYISDANNYYNSNDLDNARINYQNASKLFPKETYPQSQITKIDTQIKADAAKKIAEQAAVNNAQSTTTYNNSSNPISDNSSNNNYNSTYNASPSTKPSTQLSGGSGQMSQKVKVNGNDVQVFQQGGKYYMVNSDGSQFETTKTAYDQVSAISNKKIQAQTTAAQNTSTQVASQPQATKAVNDPLANYNSPVTTAPVTNSQLLNAITAINPNNKGLNEFAQNYAQGEQIAQVANGLIDLFSASPEEKARKERERQAAAEQAEVYRQAQLKLQLENEQNAKNTFAKILKMYPPNTDDNKTNLVINVMDIYIANKYNYDVSSMIPEWKTWMTEAITNNNQYATTVFAGKTLGFYETKFTHTIGLTNDNAIKLLEQIGDGEMDLRPYLGIAHETIKKTISEKNKKKKVTSKEINTFKITSVVPDSQAEKCGLAKNDIILKINSIYVDNVTETILKHKIGDKIDLTILRDSKEISKEAVIGSISNNYKVDAILLLANYYNIKDKGNNPEKALYNFTKAAENGSPIAMYALGEIYQNNLYGNKKINVKYKFKKNEEFALEWYTKSIQNSNYLPSSLYNQYKVGSIFEPASYDKLITMHQKGIGTKKNPEKADEFLALKNAYIASKNSEK